MVGSRFLDDSRNRNSRNCDSAVFTRIMIGKRTTIQALDVDIHEKLAVGAHLAAVC